MNQIDLEGRVVVITGGARGIGYAVAQRALRSGAQVALWDIDSERLERSKKELEALAVVFRKHPQIAIISDRVLLNGLNAR